MTLAIDRVVRQNLEAEDYLIQRITGIEAQVIDWMDKATSLYTALPAAGDKQQILDHRTALIAKLSAATAI